MELTILTAPIGIDSLDWKIQSGKNGKTLVVPYINNRCVMERFDAQFSWAGWESKFAEVADGFICTITVSLPDGTIVSKSDGASRTGIEPVKGGVSDSMKRCATQFGLGRDLYDYPKVFLEGEHKFIPDWGHVLLDRLVAANLKGGLDRAVYVLKEAQAKQLQQRA